MGKRYNNLAIYRLIAAIAIIQFHICFITYDRDIPYEALLSKAVQGLTALSGFLYSRKQINSYRDFLLSSLKKLVIPALVCAAFMAAWNLVYLISTGATDYIALFFDSREYNGSLLFQPGNYYYLLYIFICYAITPLLLDSRRRRLTVVIAALAELALSYFFGLAIILIPYLVGFAIGARFFDDYVEPEYKPTPFIAWIGIFLGSLAAYLLLVNYDFGGSYLFSHLHTLLRNITSSAVGTSSLFLVAYALKVLNRFDEPKPLQYTDRLGMIVFFMNQAFMCGAMDVTAYFVDPILDVILVYLFTLGASVLIDSMLTLAGHNLKRSTV